MIIYVSLLFCSGISSSILTNIHSIYLCKCILILRNCITNEIYKKCFTLPEDQSTKVVGILATSLQQMEVFLIYSVNAAVFAINLLIACICLPLVTSPFSLYGVLLLIILVPFIGILSKSLKFSVSKTRRLSDRRVKYLQEIIVVIKHIKLFCLFNHVWNNINNVRMLELEAISATQQTKGFQFTLVSSCSTIMLLVTLIPIALHDGYLDASNVFFMYAIFNVIRPSATQLSFALSKYQECILIMKDIYNILKPDVFNTENSQQKLQNFSLGNITMCCTKIYYKTPGFVINNANIFIPSGSLVGIVGDTASGKSTILKAILGQVVIEGYISYG